MVRPNTSGVHVGPNQIASAMALEQQAVETAAVPDTKAEEGVFFRSQVPEPHNIRARALLAAHPEIRALNGRNPWTLALISLTVAAQGTAAWYLQSAPWWVVIIAAYVFGSFLAHALWIMIHECVHRRVLKGEVANRLAGILSNLVMVLPSATAFEKYHLRHHIYQGIYEHDADLPAYWEIKLFGGTLLGRACWMLIFPILMTFRPNRIQGPPLIDKWFLINLAIVIGFDVFVVLAWGPLPLLYLALSMLFGLGLHPLGARWIQEHFTMDADQETSSYYGPLNWPQLNVGYHNEHHDFPGIPWNRLPKLRALAPEAYEELNSHQSWTRLMIDFVVFGKPEIAGRVVRPSRKPAVPIATDDAVVLKG